MQQFKISRLGAGLALLGISVIAVGLLGGSAQAQSPENSDPPVIGGDPTTPTTAAPEQDPDDPGDDTDVADDTGVVDDDVVVEVVTVEGAEEELAFTGSVTDALAYTGVALVLVGVYLTMFGQPSIPHGRHSAPSSRLRTTFPGLVVSSIAGSVGSAAKRRR